MQTRFDQAMKQLLRAALECSGAFTPALEVSPDPQSVDGYFVPDPSRPSPIARTLLGLMTMVRCSFEVFSTTPQVSEVVECVRKHLNLRHILEGREPSAPLPHQWIVSTGRPDGALAECGAGQRDSWPSGVYGLPLAFGTSILAVSELPQDRSTLLLRLMGRGRTLKRAVADLNALSEEDFERCAALPILVRFRIEVSKAPASPVDEEFLVDTQEIMDMWERRVALRERQVALEHERALIMRLLKRRFGAVPEHVARRIEAADMDTLDRFAEKLVVVVSVDDVIADGE